MSRRRTHHRFDRKHRRIDPVEKPSILERISLVLLTVVGAAIMWIVAVKLLRWAIYGE